MYPTKMEANGRIYPINTDYRVALACFKALEDTEINDIQRYYAIQTLLLGNNVLEEDEEILKPKIELYLRHGEKENTSNEEIDMDYLQDEVISKVSIRQCYHINLNETPYMHWYEYNELLSGLTKESVLNNIRELRSYDTRDIKDSKERKKIEDAKRQVALKKKKKQPTKEQKESAIKFFEALNIRKE